MCIKVELAMLRSMKKIDNSNPICERCQTVLEMCYAGDNHWTDDYWICPKCDSTYCIEK